MRGVRLVMSSAKRESRFVNQMTRGIVRPFYVLVDQVLLSNDPSCLDLNEGDIFLVTTYNKVGYWWGVSVYDLTRQGWFPSTFCQPYTGEVPQEAEEFRTTISREPGDNVEEPMSAPPVEPPIKEPVQYNIVTEDAYPFQEYVATVAVTKRGREVTSSEETSVEAIYNVDSDLEFDVSAWQEAKNVARRSTREAGSVASKRSKT